MSDEGQCIEDANLSRAWARGYLAAFDANEVHPLVVDVTGFTSGVPEEDMPIRRALDTLLRKGKLQRIDTVASTIFPASLWNPEAPRARLYERYKRVLRRVIRYRGNRYGTYFQRLISFGPQEINQLEHVLETWARGNRRRSALVASTIDPSRDHTHQPRRGFPCLQQVCFLPQRDGGLAVAGFYATQDMLERAYGNYIGLARLGRFMASEMGLRFERMTCVAATARRDSGLSKAELRTFVRSLKKLLGRDPIAIDQGDRR